MRRASAKKAVDRRKKSRSGSSVAVRREKVSGKSITEITSDEFQKTPAEKTSKNTGNSIRKPHEQSCFNCGKDLSRKERALFVEEEIGRIFCQESCIARFFTPEIERLEKEYFRKLSTNDLTGEEREYFAHLRWITLQEPDEIWREKTLTGDYRYTLISEFQPGQKRIWCVCICLFLRGEPSFLYLAFPTKNAAMVNTYRRGERVEWIRKTKAEKRKSTEAMKDKVPSLEKGVLVDRLADAWTEDETFRAQMTQERTTEDIPSEEFALYQGCLEETLETPDEVWSIKMSGEESPRLYHFIRKYPDEDPAVWYLIIARETEDEEQIEILDAFPTRDPNLVDRYRRGEQEIGQLESSRTVGRVVH